MVQKLLRAKINMSSPNLNLRDPVIYRILHKEHPKLEISGKSTHHTILLMVNLIQSKV